MKIFENLSENLIPFLISFPFEGWLLIAKISFIAFSLALIGFIIFVLVRTNWLQFFILYDTVEFSTYRPYGIRKIEREWKIITARLDTGLESEYKLAVIEADNIMDDTFKKMGYGGETLGEKLDKLTSATLPNIEEIREAHLIRNNIIHDPDYRLSLDDARKVLEIYEKAFRDLEAF